MEYDYVLQKYGGELEPLVHSPGYHTDLRLLYRMAVQDSLQVENIHFLTLRGVCCNLTSEPHKVISSPLNNHNLFRPEKVLEERIKQRAVLVKPIQPGDNEVKL